MEQGFGLLIMIILALVVYFLPSLVASGKRGAGGVFVLNLFLGWTFIGWVVALAWAAAAERPPKEQY